jgi:hypothetical protein
MAPPLYLANYQVFIQIYPQSWRWRVDCERTTRPSAEQKHKQRKN